MRTLFGFLFGTVGLMLVGCAGLPLSEGTSGPSRDVVRAPYQVEVEFESRVPVEYRVLSGPAETYQTIRLVGRLEARIRAWAAAKSTPASPVLGLRVLLQEAATEYEQVGSADQGGPLLVSRGAFRSGLELEHAGHVPYEVTKTARLSLSVEARGGGELLAAETFTVEVTQTIVWDDFEFAWAYDYLPVFEEAIRQQVRRVDGFVDGLPRPGG